MLNARVLLLLAVALFSVNWTVRDLGTLSGGGASSAQAISNDGRIVGYAYNSAGRQRAVIFKSPVVELPTLTGTTGSVANDINESGFIAGQMEGQAFVAMMGGGLYALGAGTGAHAANDNYDVAGYRVTSPTGSTNEALVWAGGSTPVSLGYLGTGSSSTATDLDEKPLACGWAEYDQSYPGFQHAFLWYEGTMLDLGVLPGGDRSGADALLVESWPDSTFAAIRVVGSSETATLDWHAFLWTGGVMTDLGVLPGHDDSRALDINRKRDIVGYSRLRGGEQRAVMWDDGVLIDLNTLLPPKSGWELVSANGINDYGEIVGAGRLYGVPRAFALKP